MARIPEDEIERLKNEVSVQRLIEDSGIALKKAGKDLLGCCPFHEDDTASLVVTPAKNLWHCFGCGIGGGPIDMLKARYICDTFFQADFPGYLRHANPDTFYP